MPLHNNRAAENVGSGCGKAQQHAEEDRVHSLAVPSTQYPVPSLHVERFYKSVENAPEFVNVLQNGFRAFCTCVAQALSDEQLSLKFRQ
jgi:hypothetical protein